jgi:hypothetical protein
LGNLSEEERIIIYVRTQLLRKCHPFRDHHHPMGAALFAVDVIVGRVWLDLPR